MKKIKHLLEVCFIRALIFVAKRFSRKKFLSLGEKTGILAYRLGVRRKIAEKNLRTAFGTEKSPAEIRQILYDSYCFAGKFLFDTVYFYFIPIEEAQKIIELNFDSAPELKKQTKTRENSVIFLTYHYSNIYSTVLLGMFFENMYNYARIQKNLLVDHFLVKIRSRFKMQAISGSNSRQQSLRQLFEVLKNQAILGYACDQNDRNTDLFVPFFNEPASISKGVGKLPLHSKADLYFFHPRLRKDCVYEFNFERVDYDTEGDKETKIRKIAEDYNRYLEKIIRREPAQYFWMHKRWKHRPPEKRETDFYK